MNQEYDVKFVAMVMRCWRQLWTWTKVTKRLWIFYRQEEEKVGLNWNVLKQKRLYWCMGKWWVELVLFILYSNIRWGQWIDILDCGRFRKRQLSTRDVENIARTMVSVLQIYI